MAQHHIAHSAVQPVINFSDEDWQFIEGHGRLRLSADDRDYIEKVARHFVLMHSAEANTVELEQVQRPLRQVKTSALSIMKALQASNFETAAGRAALMLGRMQFGPSFTLSQLNPTWHVCADLSRAADKALAELEAKAATASPGPKHGDSLAEFIRALKTIFEQRTGRKATIGTRRPKDGPEELGSVFSDFAYAIYCALCRHSMNELPTRDRSAFGVAVRRTLRGAKSTT